MSGGNKKHKRRYFFEYIQGHNISDFLHFFGCSHKNVRVHNTYKQEADFSPQFKVINLFFIQKYQNFLLLIMVTQAGNPMDTIRQYNFMYRKHLLNKLAI